MILTRWNENILSPFYTDFYDEISRRKNGFLDSFNNGQAIPAVNISETDSQYKLELVVPGKAKEDFDIRIEDDVLIVSSEEEEKKDSTDNNYTIKEYNYNSFSRSFKLPENTDKDKIEAKYENGVLILSIQKQENIEKLSQTINVS